MKPGGAMRVNDDLVQVVRAARDLQLTARSIQKFHHLVGAEALESVLDVLYEGVRQQQVAIDLLGQTIRMAKFLKEG